MSTLSSFLLSLCSLVTFWGYIFFCALNHPPSLKDLRHPPGCCSFSRVPSFHLFPVCTLKGLRRPSAVGIFTPSFLPSFLSSFLPLFFTFGLFLCVEYLLSDTGYMSVAFLRFFVCSWVCFRVVACLCFPVFCLLVRDYYTQSVRAMDKAKTIYNAPARTPTHDMKNVTSSPHVACIFVDFFSFFLCR